MKKFLALILAITMVLGMASFAVAEDLPTITVMFHGSNVTDDTAVIEAVNAYIADKVGAKLEVIWGTWGDFDDKATNAIIAGDDTIDMYFTCSWSANAYATYARNGYYLKLDDLIAEYGADLTAAIPTSLMEAARVEGADGMGIYAVNGYKDIATQNTWDVNVTLLNELGYTLDEFKALDFYSFGDLFAKAKEVKGENFYPFLVEPAVLERMVNNSIAISGDSPTTALLSYYLNPADVSAEGAYGNTVLNKFATEEFKNFVTKMHEYYVAGYVNPGVAVAETANDVRTSAQLEANYLVGTQSYSFGHEHTTSAERKIEVAYVPCTEPYIDITASQGAMVAISTASAHPVESFKFLNLLNSDAYLMTLLNYGVEGVHYNLVDGLVDWTDVRAAYTPWINGMGNITLLTDTVAEGAGFRETFKEYYASAKGIPALGYSFDYSAVETEMATLANVAAEYAFAMTAGAVDPAEKLPEFLEKLEAAGMQKYVDEANAQMEAYLATK
ncbi:MAG: ABC transporter substrate-binding protein [Clostridiales bacterium]|nr:ABC transporter substrate-binding protein [Clostridiales bacterium]